MLVLVAEVVVQGLLDLRQARPHLAAELGDRVLLLALAGMQQTVSGRFRRRQLAALKRFQAREAQAHLFGKGAVGEALSEVAFEQQQGGRDFERDGVRVPQGVTAQPLGEVAQPGDELQGRRARERGAGLGQRLHVLVEAAERDRRAFAEGVPLFARRREHLLQVLQQGGQRHVADAGAGCGHQCIELPAGADFVLVRGTCRTAGHLVENIAQQAVGRGGGAFEQAAELGIDLGAQALDADVVDQAAVDEGIVEGQCGPPQAASARGGLYRLDLGDGLAHRGRAGGMAAQPFEQAALETRPGLAQDGLGGGRVVCRRGAARRTARQVGIEEVRCAGQRESARDGDFLVQRGEPHGLVRHAVGEFLEVVAQAVHCADGEHERRLVDRHVAARHQAEQEFGCIRELGQAIEADDRQRATDLVEMRLRKLHLTRGILRAPCLVEGVRRALQGGIDLALHPGERAQIRLGG